MSQTEPTADHAPPFPKWMLAMLAVTALIVAGSAAMVVTRGGRTGPAQQSGARPGPLAPDAGLESLRVPSFSLVDQHGEPVSERVFDGRVTILDFSFTNCPFVCPGMTAAILSLQSELVGTGVRFASISVDPVHDTPSVIRAHADRMGVDHGRWTWMTGEQAEVKRIVSESLMFELQDDPSRPITLADGSTMNNIMHPSRLFLVGPDRRVLSLYTFNDPQAIDALRQRALECVRELGATSPRGG
jgi:cytochrome oxidase Cu insertion factor (SCO1/SenC/PrrC family)